MTGFGNLVIDYVSACELGTLLKNSLNGNLFCYVCYICFGNYSQARKSKAFDSLKQFKWDSRLEVYWKKAILRFLKKFQQKINMTAYMNRGGYV